MKRFVSFGEFDRELPDVAAARKLGYGKGYTIGFLAAFSILVASLVNLFYADSDALMTIRAIGLVLISFGGAFALGMVYTIVTKKGIAWSISSPGSLKSGMFERDKSPLGFWVSVAVFLLISALLIVGGVYCRVNPVYVQSWFSSYFGTATGAS
jgi:hypothetical protein